MAGNGGIIGPTNVTSRGKNTVTSKTSSGDVTTQPGTRLVETLVVAGGGGGPCGGGGGGGPAGGGGRGVHGGVSRDALVHAPQGLRWRGHSLASSRLPSPS